MCQPTADVSEGPYLEGSLGAEVCPECLLKPTHELENIAKTNEGTIWRKTVLEGTTSTWTGQSAGCMGKHIVAT